MGKGRRREHTQGVVSIINGLSLGTELELYLHGYDSRLNQIFKYDCNKQQAEERSGPKLESELQAMRLAQRHARR